MLIKLLEIKNKKFMDLTKILDGNMKYNCF